jgi:hypothetical protein
MVPRDVRAPGPPGSTMSGQVPVTIAAIRATMSSMAETDDIAAALGRFTDDDLERLRAAADSSPDMVPGLLHYLDHAGDWEQHRRLGVDFKLQAPIAALEESESDAALAALRVLSARFLASGHDDASALFDAVADALRPSARSISDESLH